VQPGTAADELLLGFARALRAAGVPTTQDRAQTFVKAVARVGFGDRSATYWAGRATLCSGPEDSAAYDRVFSAWFLDDATPTPGRPRTSAPPLVQAPLGAEEQDGAGGAEDQLRIAASAAELLRHRDVATLDAAERARLTTLFTSLQPVAPQRRSPRRRPHRRGTVDTRVTLRRTLARLGEPVEIARRRRSRRPRRVVLLLDVSGSMSAYADALLRLAHRVVTAHPGRAGSGAEVFSVGTRLTRLTPALRQRDADRALVAAGETVPDWSGGTRLAEGLEVFLDRWGQRGLVRGAVVVLFSDGWERGDAALLGEQMARLRRLAHKVVWANPHKGAAGYQPVQAGMAAALPHVDAFVAGHSLAAFTAVLEEVARA